MDIRKKASWVARTVVLVVTVTLVLEGVLVWDLVSAYVNRPAIDLGTSGNTWRRISAIRLAMASSSRRPTNGSGSRGSYGRN